MFVLWAPLLCLGLEPICEHLYEIINTRQRGAANAFFQRHVKNWNFCPLPPNLNLESSVLEDIKAERQQKKKNRINALRPDFNHSQLINIDFVDESEAYERWKSVKQDGILVVKMTGNGDANSGTGQGKKTFDDIVATGQSGGIRRVPKSTLAWNAMYASQCYHLVVKVMKENRREGEMMCERYRLPGLRHVSYVKDYIVLQKDSDRFLPRAARGQFTGLFAQTRSDKLNLGHNYSIIYSQFLRRFGTNQKGTFLEIGLGCGRYGRPGYSAVVWSTMFPKMQLKYIEYDKSCHWEARAGMEKRQRHIGIQKLYGGSQDDPKLLNEVVQDAQNKKDEALTLIIDDGSHVDAHIITSFMHLFPYQVPGGLYFAEDLLMSMGGHDKMNDPRRTSSKNGTSTKIVAPDSPEDFAPVSLFAGLGMYNVVGKSLKDEKSQWIKDMSKEIGNSVSQIDCTAGICVLVRSDEAARKI